MDLTVEFFTFLSDSLILMHVLYFLHLMQKFLPVSQVFGPEIVLNTKVGEYSLLFMPMC